MFFNLFNNILKENINKIVKRLRAVPLKEALCEAVLSY